jgi:hypothetical protein
MRHCVRRNPRARINLHPLPQGRILASSAADRAAFERIAILDESTPGPAMISFLPASELTIASLVSARPRAASSSSSPVGGTVSMLVPSFT